jgi:hypothetical protein
MLYLCSSYNKIKQFFNQAFMFKTCISADFQKFLGVSHKRIPHRTHSPLSHSYCSAGFGWLGVDLEVRSLCY